MKVIAMSKPNTASMATLAACGPPGWKAGAKKPRPRTAMRPLTLRVSYRRIWNELCVPHLESGPSGHYSGRTLPAASRRASAAENASRCRRSSSRTSAKRAAAASSPSALASSANCRYIVSTS